MKIATEHVKLHRPRVTVSLLSADEATVTNKGGCTTTEGVKGRKKFGQRSGDNTKRNRESEARINHHQEGGCDVTEKRTPSRKLSPPLPLVT